MNWYTPKGGIMDHRYGAGTPVVDYDWSVVDKKLAANSGKKMSGTEIAAAVHIRSLHDKPTAEELHKHVEKFGPELVAETGTQLGVHIKLERAPRVKRRAERRNLLEETRGLAIRGLLGSEIAEALNLSEVRVRQLLEKIQAGR